MFYLLTYIYERRYSNSGWLVEIWMYPHVNATIVSVGIEPFFIFVYFITLLVLILSGFPLSPMKSVTTRPLGRLNQGAIIVVNICIRRE